MSALPFLHFFSVITYLYMGAYVIIKNPKSLLNRTCFATILCFCFWSFSLIFVHNPYATKETARLFYSIGSFAWTSFAGFALWFMLVFAEHKKLLKTKLLYPALFIIPSILIYKQWTGHVAADYIRRPWGWGYVWADSIWAYLFYLYYFIFMGIGLFLLSKLAKKAKEELKRKQARIIFSTTLLALILSSLTDVVLPRLDIYLIPNIAPFFIIIWVVGLTLTIAKYEMLAITPATAARNIISTMADSLIVLDDERKIAFVNEATPELLGYKKRELEGKMIDMLFPDELKDTQSDKTVQDKDSSSDDFILETKDRRNIPVIFSRSVMRSRTRDVIGTVCIARDITGRKKAEVALKKGRDELKMRVERRTNELQQANIQLRKEISERKKTAEFLLKEKNFSGSVIDSLPGIFYIFDYRGKLLQWNRHALEVTGYTAEEAPGIKMSRFLDKAEFKTVARAVRDVFMKGKADAEVNLVTKDGRKIPYLLTGSFAKVENKKCLMGFGIDISEHKKVEEEARKHLKELEVFYKSNIGREERILQLKREIKELKAKQGEK